MAKDQDHRLQTLTHHSAEDPDRVLDKFIAAYKKWRQKQQAGK
ncbi:MAG: hypothetical protein WC451_04900 [Patescibacteria group bacterium]|jgi:hypothetical protein